jgi:hypothetical protein
MSKEDRMRGKGGLLGRLAGLLFVACFIISIMATPGRAATINGWNYSIPDVILTSYQVGNYTYNQYGLIATFTTNSGSGSAQYSNLVFDASGHLTSATVQVTGIPAVEGQSATVSHGGEVSPIFLASLSAAQSASEFRYAQQVVNWSILRSERRAVEGTLYNRMRTALIPGYVGQPGAPAAVKVSGVASGDAGAGLSPVWSMWVDGSITSVGNSLQGSESAATNYMGLVGVECAPSQRFLVGLGMGYSSIDTTYHYGNGAKQHDYGFIINPYIGFSLVDNLLFAVQGGLTFTNTDLSGQTGSGLASLYANNDSNYGVLTAAIGADVSYAIVLDRLVITPHVGYSYSSRQPSSSDVKGVQIGLFNAGGMIGYNFDKLTPFLSATYSYDTIGQLDVQRDDMHGAAGLTFRPNDRFQATASVGNAFFRHKEYETTFDLNLRYTF